MEKTVNIIGLGYGGHNAPLDCGDRWTLNSGFIYPDINRLFLMHDFQLIKDSITINGSGILDLVGYLKKQDKMDIVGLNSFYIEDVKEDYPYFNPTENHKGEVIKTVQKYPIEQISKMIGGSYFPYTSAYMMALAIFEGYERIRLYGFEIFSYPQNKNYPGQDESLISMVSFAKGRGIKVDIDFMFLSQTRMKNNLYGYFL